MADGTRRRRAEAERKAVESDPTAGPSRRVDAEPTVARRRSVADFDDSDDEVSFFPHSAPKKKCSSDMDELKQLILHGYAAADAMKSDIKGQFDAVRTDVRSQFDAVNCRFDSSSADVKSQFDTVKTDV